MNRLSTLLWMVVIVGAAFGLYVVKYQVQSIRSQINETARALEAEKEALHVAAAEWAYLNRPQRLRELSQKYLVGSAPLTVEQVAEVEAIPFVGMQDASLAVSSLEQP